MKTRWEVDKYGTARAESNGMLMQVDPPLGWGRTEWHVHVQTPWGRRLRYMKGTARGPRKAREKALQYAYVLRKQTGL